MIHNSIDALEIERYGCIKRAFLNLSPVHALIGPNDSGKSTILRTLQIASLAVSAEVLKGSPFPPELGVDADSTLQVGLAWADGRSVRLVSNQHGFVATVRDTAATAELAKGSWPYSDEYADGASALRKALDGHFTRAMLVRFEPDSLRAPSSLIPEAEGIAFADAQGRRLPGVFDAIINRDAEAFAKIQQSVRAHFPSVSKVNLLNVSSTEKEIGITITDGTKVGAKNMSEGLLYFLGFQALRYVSNCSHFLVEEPENGLHPSRIADVMGILREISKTSQVIIATHSPLVVNELQGHEISVITRTPDRGTEATLLRDVPGYDDAMKVYQPGEFWLSYADGKQEEALLRRPEPHE